jgi:hypothetical protein
MEGRLLGRQFALNVQREFARSRLEEQILVRVFELVVPASRRTLAEDEQPGTASVAEQIHSVLAKGA